MSIHTPDKMGTAQLVATVLGMSDFHPECVRLAQCITQGDSAYATTDKRVARIQAAIELGRRSLMVERVNTVDQLSTPEEVVALMEPYYIGLEREVFYCLCLNTKNHLKKMVEVSIGSLNASIVHPRELFRIAVEVSAASIVVVHNHPSGDPTPSNADLQLTRRLTRAGEVIGIEVLDHVVIGGEGRHVSMREQGTM